MGINAFWSVWFTLSSLSRELSVMRKWRKFVNRGQHTQQQKQHQPKQQQMGKMKIQNGKRRLPSGGVAGLLIDGLAAGNRRRFGNQTCTIGKIFSTHLYKRKQALVYTHAHTGSSVCAPAWRFVGEKREGERL